MRIILLQHNPTPGDFRGNARQLADMALAACAAAPASAERKTLCITPAYAVAGVPWKNLIRIGGFYRRCREAAAELADMLKDGPDMLISLTGAEEPLYVLLSEGMVYPLSVSDDGYLKLPGGGCFYVPGTDPAWAHQEAAECLSKKKASSVDAILFTESPVFLPGSHETREMHCSALASMWHIPVVAVSQFGAVDGLVYSGQSFILDSEGEVAARAAAFHRAAIGADIRRKEVSAFALPAEEGSVPPAVSDEPDRWEGVFHAMVRGVRDYVRKCGMTGVVIGLSGGMDSALVAAVAAEALGPANVLAVLMPSRWSTGHSETDAEELAANLGIEAKTARITPMMDAFDSVLQPLFGDLPAVEGDLTAENIQPRIRGALLMAFANRLGRAVLGTGNKSENAVGYCTLYGDTVGALEPLSDLYKTEVYQVARWYNGWKGREVIPEHIFTKAPSAELRPDQKDEDSLPPYPVLDAILFELIENGANPETPPAPGAAQAAVRDVVRKLARAEFKRHQCPPGIKLTPCTFGMEWHLPATSKGL
ncbi:MAG: NAD(+) synthase [Mailhella sp.]|nr:NAD(+) synthase [Mailhella sp.]